MYRKDAINDTLIAVFGNSATMSKVSDYQNSILSAKDIVNKVDITDDDALRLIEFHPEWHELCEANDGKDIKLKNLALNLNIRKTEIRNYIRPYKKTLHFGLNGFREMALLLFILRS